MGKERQRRCVNCDRVFKPDARNAKHQQYCEAEACRAASKQASQAKWLAMNPGYHCGSQPGARVKVWRQKHPGYSRRKPAPPNGSPIQESLPFETGALELAQTEILAPPQLSSAPPAPPIETSIQEGLTLKPGAAEPTPTESLAPPQISSAPPIETSIQESLPLEPGAAKPTPTESLAPPQKSCNAFEAPLQDLLNAQQIVLIGLISHLWGSALQDDIALILIRLIQLGLDIRGGHHEHAHETNIESGTPSPGA